MRNILQLTFEMSRDVGSLIEARQTTAVAEGEERALEKLRARS